MLRLDQLNAAGERHVLAKFNWTDKEIVFDLIPEKYHLPSADYWVREFWGGKTGLMSNTQPFSVTVPPHGCAVVTVKLKTPNRHTSAATCIFHKGWNWLNGMWKKK